MKKVLYLTNIETPYRVRFFNELAEICDLTVLYERKTSSNRDRAWAQSETRDYRIKNLRGIPWKTENAISMGILKEVLSGYDAVIVGCFNSPVQIMAMILMRILRKPYALNLDGEPFLEGTGLKARLKRFFLKGAGQYLVAGEQSAQSVRRALGDAAEIIPYYFSSLSEAEAEANGKTAESCQRDHTVLVVGQYFDYKGMDVALEAARMDPQIQYKFVGMGQRIALFTNDHEIPANVQVIPFLQKADLEQEYRRCGMLVLPSRQECWGLVINEAASFGMPIVSTWGSGAAVEFLGEEYPQYLAKPGDARDLLHCIRLLCQSPATEEYSQALMKKAKQYTIDRSVQAYSRVVG